MARPGPPSPLRSEDYDAIQAAVMETTRGRWFLSEYAKHNRSADTEILLDAIQKLHGTLVKQTDLPEDPRLKNELMDIASAIASTKNEIAAMSETNGDGDKITSATMELDAIVTTAEKATGDILNIAEQIQEIGWTLREGGIDEKSCDALDRHATDIYTACSFQDLTGQRTQKVIKILTFIDQRIEAMMDIWNGNEATGKEIPGKPIAGSSTDIRSDEHLLNGPQFESEAPSQDDIDDLLATDPCDVSVMILDDNEVVEPELLEVQETIVPAKKTTSRICWADHPADTDIPEVEVENPPASQVDVSPTPPDISASSVNPISSVEIETNLSGLSNVEKMTLFS
jgi:hypothetical protein